MVGSHSGDLVLKGYSSYVVSMRLHKATANRVRASMLIMDELALVEIGGNSPSQLDKD